MRNIREFYGKKPQIADSVFVDESATVIGDVEIGEDSSIWPQVSVRGDLLKITIGKKSNIQDCSSLHTAEIPHQSGEGFPLTIGDNVIIGHAAVLHGCDIGDSCLIGMGAIVLDGAIIESEVMVGAGSLVPPGKRLESGYMYLGSPVKQIRPLTDKEKKGIVANAENYVLTKNRYKQEA